MVVVVVAYRPEIIGSKQVTTRPHHTHIHIDHTTYILHILQTTITHYAHRYDCL